MKIVKLISIAIASLSLLVLAGCSKLTEENYQKLEMGMEMSQVESLLGKADSCEEALGAQACIWGDDQKHIKVKLVADKVVFFSKKGLE